MLVGLWLACVSVSIVRRIADSEIDNRDNPCRPHTCECWNAAERPTPFYISMRDLYRCVGGLVAVAAVVEWRNGGLVGCWGWRQWRLRWRLRCSGRVSGGGGDGGAGAAVALALHGDDYMSYNLNS